MPANQRFLNRHRPESEQNCASTPLPKVEARQTRFVAGTIVDIVVFIFGTEMNDVTQILSQIESGDSAASEQLLPLVYEELRRLAARLVLACRTTAFLTGA